MKSKKFTFCAMLCISMLLSITAAYAQVEERERLPDDVFPGDAVLFKPSHYLDRGILYMDVGELIGNSRTYGYWQSNYFPYMVHGYWGEIYRMFPMVGMPPGPWGADIPTSEFGSVDRSMNYNVLELVQNIVIYGQPLNIYNSDWEARDFNLTRAMGGPEGARDSRDIPLIAIRTQEDTWPEGYYGAEDKFAGSGVWTDTPGERHWPGRWARETDPASPDYWKPVYGRFASAKDAYYSEYDKYAGIRPGDDINTSYPVGLDMETSVYCYASPLYEDIIYWDVDLIFMEEDWVQAPNGDVTMGDPYRNMYTGTIDDMYFGMYWWTQFPDYRRESSRDYARPWGHDTMAWFEAPDALFFYFKYGWHQRQWGTPYSGPVSIYSLYFPKTPYDLGITAFHWFEERDIDNYAPGQNWEARLYAMMSGQPEILHDDTGYEKNLLFHPYPEAGEEPNYKIDNIDSLIHWHDYREDGTIRLNTLDCTGYGLRPNANFMIGTGPFSMSPGDTMEITFCMFGSDDNPGPLSPGSADDRQMEYDRWPINDPLKFSVDPHDRFYDVYLNLDAAEDLYNSFLEDPTNVAPFITTTSLPYAVENVQYDFTVPAQDLNFGDILTFSLLEGPAWLSMNSKGELIGIPTSDDVGADTVSIRVEDTGGLSDTLNTDLFTFTDTGGESPETIITSISPAELYVGQRTLLTITGINLQSATGVYLDRGEIAENPPTANADGTELTVYMTMPAGQVLGNATVTVYTLLGSTTIDIALIGATITSIDPALLKLGERTLVTITGMNLQGVTSVSINGDTANVETPSVNPEGTEVTAYMTVPVDYAAGNAVVAVHTPLGSPEINITLISPTEAVISSISPSELIIGQRTLLTITGANLHGVTSVTINRDAAIVETPSVNPEGTEVTLYMTVPEDQETGEATVTVYTPQDSVTVTLILVANNWYPEFYPQRIKGVSVGNTLLYTLTASDPDGDALTWSADNLPHGATLNSVTGEFEWIPSAVGEFTITFNVYDGMGHVESRDVTINVVEKGEWYFSRKGSFEVVNYSGEDFSFFGGAILNKVYFSDHNNGWIVGSNGVILHTTNAGRDWIQQESGMDITLNDIFFIDENTGGIAGDDGVILHTVNGGQTWTSQESSTSYDLYSICYIDSSNGLVVGNYGRICRTANGGQSWERITSVTSSILYDITFVNSSLGWAASNEGEILVTTDGGQTWELKNTRLGVSFRSLSFLDNNTGWAAGFDGTIIHTIDGGNSWSVQATALPAAGPTIYDIYFTNRNNGWAGTDNGVILRTTDGGQNWTSINTGITSNVNGIHFVDSFTGWLVEYNGLILHTVDGGVTWTSQTFTAFLLEDIYFVDDNTGWAVGLNNTVLKTMDNGHSWNLQLCGSQLGSRDLIGVYFNDQNTGWVVPRSDPNIRSTTDGGATWTNMRIGSENYNWRKFAFVSDTEGWIAGGSLGILAHTTDSGKNWEVVSCPGYNNINIFFRDSQNGWLIGYGGIVAHTSDGGQNWTNMYVAQVGILWGIYFTDNNTGWVAGSSGDLLTGYLYGTTDGGQTWNEVSLGTVTSFFDVLFVNNAKGWVVGDNGTIYHTTDGGATWNLQESGTTQPLKQIIRKNNTIWAVGGAGQVLRLDLDETGSSINDWKDGIITDYALLPNYPNPFNPETTIGFQIPRPSFVTLKIYNTLGQLIKTLVSADLISGKYDVIWDGTNESSQPVSSGLYIYHLQAGEFSAVKKMLFIK